LNGKTLEADETVLVLEEYSRIIDFLISRMKAGVLTDSDWSVVKGEEARINHEVGYTDKHGKYNAADGDEFIAVAKQINHLMRKKIGELHPDLVDELNQWISETRYPLPPLPPELEVPGVALRQYRDLMIYLDDMGRKGLISDEHAYGATDPAAALFAEHGVQRFEIDLNTDKAVLYGAAQVIRRKLLEVRPDLADEIANLGRGGLGK
jgi:hypothetical protein